MKIYKCLTLLVLMLLTGITVKANIKTDTNKFTIDHAVKTYTDALIHGKLAGLKEVIDESAEFSMLQGKEQNSYSKRKMLDFFLLFKGTNMDCTTTNKVIERCGEIAVIKLDLLFKRFTRSDYVTIVHKDDKWKIIYVYSVFSNT